MSPFFQPPPLPNADTKPILLHKVLQVTFQLQFEFFTAALIPHNAMLCNPL